MACKATRDFVTTFVKSVNFVLANSVCSADVRQGEINVISQMLHAAKMYKGFRYLMLDQVPNGELPGIVVHGTVEATPHEVRFAKGCVDTTRIEFFI